MTREEAIRHGKEQLEIFGEGCEHYEFINMAIKTLEQEPCDECRNKHTSFCGNCNKYDEYEPCEDAISREDALEALNTINGTAELDKAFEVIENSPSVTQKPTECEDAISREDVIKLVECSGYDLQFRTDNADMCDDVRKLPSVTPSRRKGHWIAVYQGDEIINYRCSECELGDTNGSTNLYGWDYCRRCGAEMESEE